MNDNEPDKATPGDSHESPEEPLSSFECLLLSIGIVPPRRIIPATKTLIGWKRPWSCQFSMLDLGLAVLFAAAGLLITALMKGIEFRQNMTWWFPLAYALPQVITFYFGMRYLQFRKIESMIMRMIDLSGFQLLGVMVGICFLP